MNGQVKLFAVEGSRSSCEAQKVLEEAGVDFWCIDARSTGAFARLEYDLGITSLPAAITPRGILQGVDAIKDYAQSNGLSASS